METTGEPLSDKRLAQIAQFVFDLRMIGELGVHNLEHDYVRELFSEVERMRPIVRAVAKGPLSYDGFGGYTCVHCEQEFMENGDPDDDAPGAIEHTADCPVTQARALLASADATLARSDAPERE